MKLDWKTILETGHYKCLSQTTHLKKCHVAAKGLTVYVGVKHPGSEEVLLQCCHENLRIVCK